MRWATGQKARLLAAGLLLATCTPTPPTASVPAAEPSFAVVVAVAGEAELKTPARQESASWESVAAPAAGELVLTAPPSAQAPEARAETVAPPREAMPSGARAQATARPLACAGRTRTRQVALPALDPLPSGEPQTSGISLTCTADVLTVTRWGADSVAVETVPREHAMELWVLFKAQRTVRDCELTVALFLERIRRR